MEQDKTGSDFNLFSRIYLQDSGLEFNGEIRNSAFRDTLHEMRCYGGNLKFRDRPEGFRTPTVPELVPLIYSAFEKVYGDPSDSPGKRTAEKILQGRDLTGDTLLYFLDEGIFVEDNPTIREKNRIGSRTFKHPYLGSYIESWGYPVYDFGVDIPSFKELESRLSSYQEGNVVFSHDRKLRFIDYGSTGREKKATPHGMTYNPGIKENIKNYEDIREDSGLIALVGGKKNSEKIAKMTEDLDRKFSNSGSGLDLWLTTGYDDFQKNKYDVRTVWINTGIEPITAPKNNNVTIEASSIEHQYATFDVKEL